MTVEFLCGVRKTVVVMDVQVYEYRKKITELHFKWVNCVECELHFNKAINIDWLNESKSTPGSLMVA